MAGWSRCSDSRILNSYIIRPKKPIRRLRFFIIFTLPCSTCNIAGVCKAYPRRPKGSQSGRKKRRDESFKHGRKSPWVKTLTGASPNSQPNAASWLRTKMLCIILPNRQTASAEFFSCVRTRLLCLVILYYACPVRSPRLCMQGKLSFSTLLTRNDSIIFLSHHSTMEQTETEVKCCKTF